MDYKNSADSNSRMEDSSLTGLVAQVQNENTRDYIVNRIMPQMKWYSDKSKAYKQQYHRWMTTSIVLNAAIPVASVFADGTTLMKVLIAALGATVTAISAYLSLNSSKDLWLTYRNTRETLLRILYYYFNDAGIFSQGETQEKKDALLIDICEEELSHETGGWLSVMNMKQ